MIDLQPLGDQAVLAYFSDERSAFQFAEALRNHAPPWLIDVVQAYAAVAAFFDPVQHDLDDVLCEVGHLAGSLDASDAQSSGTGKLHEIPCCYEMNLDLARIAEIKGLASEEVVTLHASTNYVVYAIGFCPGFPYLGYLPDELAGVPRLESPRLHVDAGSVALTGRQTGIYTEARPGGWNVIGRTPLELVNVADGYFPLRTGDKVRFTRIDESEFEKLRGSRL